jgi:hypothetical protein
MATEGFEVVTPMKLRSLPLILTFSSCLTAYVPTLIAQTTSTQIFTPVNVRTSVTTTSTSSPATFNSSTLSLTCSASPIIATITGPSGGPVLVDNTINLTVTPSGGSATGPVNICTGGFPSPVNSCFNTNYEGPASSGSLNGVNPDTLTASGGVPPIDISSNLVSGTQSVTIGLVDLGGFLTGSSVFLNTNCTYGGVTGPAMVSGNTITPTSQLTQTFPFNSSTQQQVGFQYDVSGAAAAGTLTVDVGGSNPQVGDMPLDPATFQPTWAVNTPFATSACLVHSGELLPLTNNPACKLFTLECTVGTGASASGAQCPLSTARNEGVDDIFDGPAITLHDIPTAGGPTFHEGFGLLMASEGWAGGPCAFDPASGLETLPCPQNQLISFSGPGLFTGSAAIIHPNSTFISVAQVPEDLTTVTVTNEWPTHWINSSTAKLKFVSVPPNLTKTKLLGAANFIPSPIQSISYGISAVGSVPDPGNIPIATDTTLTNSTPCPLPTASAPGPTIAPTFAPSQQSISGLADGSYLVHYYAEDCAGTEELAFSQVGGSWVTNFYTHAINIDTVAPTISTLVPSAAGPYTKNQKVTVSFSCSDATSGVVLCGLNLYAPGTTHTTPTLTYTLNTSSSGKKTFAVAASDAAVNLSAASITYTVK